MPSELQPILNPADPRAIARAVRDAGRFLGIDRARVIGTPETDTTNPRTVVIQCIDRLGQPKTGRFWVRLMFGTSPYLRTGGITVTVLSAAASYFPVADQVLEALTDEDGTITLEIDHVGSWYITGSIGLEAFNLGATVGAMPPTPGATGESMGLLLALTYA